MKKKALIAELATVNRIALDLEDSRNDLIAGFEVWMDAKSDWTAHDEALTRWVAVNQDQWTNG